MVLDSRLIRPTATSTARAASSIAGRPIRMTQASCRDGVWSANRRSWMKARWRRSRICPTCRTCTTFAEGQVRHEHLRRGAGQDVQRFHGQGQERRQAVFRLAQHDADARLDVPVSGIQGADEQQVQLRPGRGRHDADGRQYRRNFSSTWTRSAKPTTRSSFSPPTTGRKCSPGRMAA